MTYTIRDEFHAVWTRYLWSICGLSHSVHMQCWPSSETCSSWSTVWRTESLPKSRMERFSGPAVAKQARRNWVQRLVDWFATASWSLLWFIRDIGDLNLVSCAEHSRYALSRYDGFETFRETLTLGKVRSKGYIRSLNLSRLRDLETRGRKPVKTSLL